MSPDADGALARALIVKAGRSVQRGVQLIPPHAQGSEGLLVVLEKSAAHVEEAGKKRTAPKDSVSCLEAAVAGAKPRPRQIAHGVVASVLLQSGCGGGSAVGRLAWRSLAGHWMGLRSPLPRALY